MNILKLIIFFLCMTLITAYAACQVTTSLPSTGTLPTPPVSSLPSTQSSGPTTASTKVTWVADGIITPGEYQKSKTYNDYEIAWSSDDQYIYVGIRAKTTGWVAVGFDPEIMMKNADIIQGYVKDGTVTIVDMFSTGEFGPHPPDTQLGGTNDILESGGKIENEYTVIEFKRKLDTGDKFDKPLHKGINKIMWAYGSDTQITIKHLVRGYGELDL